MNPNVNLRKHFWMRTLGVMLSLLELLAHLMHLHTVPCNFSLCVDFLKHNKHMEFG
ncbi:hypothetical protein LguiB_024207 [Lonicera macranthoides]